MHDNCSQLPVTSNDIALEIAEAVQQLLPSGPKPVVAMVTGPPATGKTVLCAKISERLGAAQVLTLVDDREIHSRKVRESLGVTGIDHKARNMAQLKQDLSSLRRGMAVLDKVYERFPDRDPEVVSRGSLDPKPVVLLDGFAWCYEDFDGLWDLKYVLLPYSFEHSEKMSISRDKDERHYGNDQAASKHLITYRAYSRHEDHLRRRADRIYRVSSDYDFRVETMTV